jgi:hypothetical protein
MGQGSAIADELMLILIRGEVAIIISEWEEGLQLEVWRSGRSHLP